MAQAAFFVNDLKIIDKGKFLILEGQRRCGQGVIEHVFLTFPPELKHLFTEFAGTSDQDVEASEADARIAWQSRLEKYFDRDS